MSNKSFSEDIHIHREYHEHTTTICTFDKRSSLTKLHAIIDYLRLTYVYDDQIPHDDVAFAIENTVGCDPRTVTKYLGLLVRHDYLKPYNPKAYEYRVKRTTVKTKFTTHPRDYQTRVGWKSYVFGPKAKRTKQTNLMGITPSLLQKFNSEDLQQNPPRSPPSKISECHSQNYMCVSDSPSVCSISEPEKAPLGAIVGEKRERDSVTHTYFSNHVMNSKSYDTDLGLPSPRDVHLIHKWRKEATP